MIQPATPYIGEPATLPLALIHTGPQIRTRNGFDQGSLAELAASIHEHGLLQPIIVHRNPGNDGYTVIAGERRLLACEMAGLAEAPVLIREGHHADQIDAMQAVENLQRMGLHLLDEADKVATLVERLGARKTAQLLAKSPAWVSKRRSIAKMREEVRAIAAAGITDDPEVLGLMQQLQRLNAEQFDRAAKALEDGKVSREQLRKLVADLKAPKAPPAADDGGNTDEDEGEGTAPPTAPPSTLQLSEDDRSALRSAVTFALDHPGSFSPDHLPVLRALQRRLGL